MCNFKCFYRPVCTLIVNGGLCLFFHFFLEWDSSEGPDQIENAPHRNRGKCVLLRSY